MKRAGRTGLTITLLCLAILITTSAWGRPVGDLDEWNTSPLRPYDIAILTDGSIWLNFYNMADADTGKVFTIDLATGNVRDIEAPFPSRFGAIDKAPDNSLWLGDHHHSLVHFDPATEVYTRYALPADLFDLPDGLDEHMGVRTAPDGTVWFTSWADPVVGAFDPETGDWRRFALPIEGEHPPGVPVEIAFTSDGMVWFTVREWSGRGGGLGRLNPETDEITLWTDPEAFPTGCFSVAGPRTPHGIMVRDDVVWFVDHHAGRLLSYDPLRPEGRFQCFPLPDDRTWDAHYLAADRYGVFWLTAFGADAVLTFDPATGDFDDLRLTARAQPMGIAIAPNGDIWWAETFEPGYGGVGRFRPGLPLGPYKEEPPVREGEFRRLNLIDCGPCPHCFDRPCDPRINLDHDRFVVWDPEEDILASFSLSKLGLRTSDGTLAAAAPLQTDDGRTLFVATAPSARDGAGTILFFDDTGKTIARINGRKGERLGVEMDVRSQDIVVASTRRLLRLRNQKIVWEQKLEPGLSAQRGVRVAFTDDTDGDRRPDILLGTPYASSQRFHEAGQIQLIRSRDGAVRTIAQGRATGEHLGRVLMPIRLEGDASK